MHLDKEWSEFRATCEYLHQLSLKLSEYRILALFPLDTFELGETLENRIEERGVNTPLAQKIMEAVLPTTSAKEPTFTACMYMIK